MKLINQAHLDSAKELVELMSIAGWLALLADLIWVVVDGIHAGMPARLLPVFILLSIGFIIMTIGVMQYHKKQYKARIKQLLYNKLHCHKRKFKRT